MSDCEDDLDLRRARRLHTAMLLVPCVQLGALAQLAFWSSLRLGRWPRPYADDPSLVGLQPLQVLNAALFVTVFACAPYALVLALWFMRRPETRREGTWRFGLVLVVWAVWFALVRADPLDVVRWFMD